MRAPFTLVPWEDVPRSRTLNNLVQHVLNGGAIALPVDTGCYALVGDPANAKATAKIARLLDHENDPMPVNCIDEIHMAEVIKIGRDAERVLADVDKGTVTVVGAAVHPHSRIARNCGGNGTIGVRASSSPLEHYLALQARQPLLTPAVRDSTKALIKTGKEVIEYLDTAMTAKGLDDLPLLVCVSDSFRYSDNSTVIKMRKDGSGFDPIREGVADVAELRAALRRFSPYETADFT